MPILKRSGRPSYGRGFARSASESEAPGLWKGLKGLWLPTLGRTEGILRDVSGFGNHGVNGATWVIGANPKLPGYALDFNVQSVTGMSAPLFSEFSIAAFVRVETFTANSFFVDASPSTSGWGIRIGSGGIGSFSFLCYRSGGLLNLSNIVDVLTAGKWHHIIGVMGLGGIRAYVDGIEVGSLNGTGTVAAQTSMVFGQSVEGSSSFDGAIGLVALYNRALAPAEIKQLYEQPEAMFTRRRRIYASVAPTGFVPYPHVPGMTGGIAI